MIIGWVAAIFLLGGYRPQVFGAGLDEYKRMVYASLVTAAASASAATCSGSSSPAGSSSSPS